MRIALGIVDMFPGGGLQRDCLRVADILRRRGHDTEVLAARCDPAVPRAAGVRVLRVSALSNHARDAAFGAALLEATRGRFDVLTGFNKLPGLDLLYCADPSIAARDVPAWQRWLPRYRTRSRLEAACFAPSSQTRLVLLAETAAADYRRVWRTQPERITILPPAIAPERVQPQLRSEPERTRRRDGYGLAADRLYWLWIGSAPRTKGLDRVLSALGRHPDADLLVVGIAAEDRAASSLLRQAERLGVSARVSWLGYRDDVAGLMAAADVLVHPARYDMTGQSIMEAIAMGLPAIVTEACGYAIFVRECDCGLVLGEPFADDALDRALEQARVRELRARWSAKALAFAAARDLTSGLEIACDQIEQAGVSKAGAPIAA